jgi:hypothetical protein
MLTWPFIILLSTGGGVVASCHVCCFDCRSPTLRHYPHSGASHTIAANGYPVYLGADLTISFVRMLIGIGAVSLGARQKRLEADRSPPPGPEIKNGWAIPLLPLDLPGVLKMEAIFSSEMSVDFQRTTRRYIPEYSTLHNHRRENLKSCIMKFDLKSGPPK